MILTDNLTHEKFCMPRPGEDKPRIEGYRLPKYAADGITQVSSVSCVRCQECGVISYDGRQPGV